MRARGSIRGRVFAVGCVARRLSTCAAARSSHVFSEFFFPHHSHRLARIAGTFPGRLANPSKQVHCHRNSFSELRAALGAIFKSSSVVSFIAVTALVLVLQFVLTQPAKAFPFDMVAFQNVNLGDLGPDATVSGTGSIDHAQVVTTTGGVANFGGTQTTALVQVALNSGFTGDSVNTTFDVTSSTTLTGSGGGSITFNNVQHNQPASLLLLKGGGGAIVTLAGIANIAANQTAGTYTGTVWITATNIDNPLQFDTVSITVTVTIETPISISKALDLSFGAINASGIAGTVSIDRTAVRSVTGGVTLDSADNGTYGQVTVSGKPNQAFTFSVPANNTIVLSNGTGGTMLIQSWDIPGVLPLDASGLRGKRIGGTLTVGANQAGGTYTGTFTVNATYD